MAIDLPRIYVFDIYTLSNNKAQYEPSKWNGIVDNNNSTISTTWILNVNNSDDIFNFPAGSGKTGTYKKYQVNPPNNIDSSYEKINDSSKAELTYWVTTDYGGTTYTSYFYYKKVTQQLHQYSLQLAINIVFDPLLYEDCGAFLTTRDFAPTYTDNPNRFHLLNVKSDGSGKVQ